MIGRRGRNGSHGAHGEAVAVVRILRADRDGLRAILAVFVGVDEVLGCARGRSLGSILDVVVLLLNGLCWEGALGGGVL